MRISMSVIIYVGALFASVGMPKAECTDTIGYQKSRLDYSYSFKGEIITEEDTIRSIVAKDSEATVILDRNKKWLIFQDIFGVVCGGLAAWGVGESFYRKDIQWGLIGAGLGSSILIQIPVTLTWVKNDHAAVLLYNQHCAIPSSSKYVPSVGAGFTTTF